VLINNAEMAALCRAGRGRADAILVPIISPYRLGRARARAVIGHGFHEIYFSADQQCVAARDAKGLYAKAARGEIPAMIGFATDSPYEPPTSPELTLDTAAETPQISAEKLTRFVLKKL
jgi:adenylylsulfate kinase-like enzyme